MISIPGFQFSSVYSGVKKSGKKDLALIFSETHIARRLCSSNILTTHRSLHAMLIVPCLLMVTPAI